MNVNKLKEILKRKRITNEMIADELDMTPQGVQSFFSRQSIKVKHLEGICKMIQMHPGEFFEGEFVAPVGNHSELIQSLRGQISLQKEVIKYKDQQLAECLKKVPVHS